MLRLIYVSRSRLPEAEADDAVRAIVRVSRERNAREGISGALLFTGTGFAQVLEGGVDAVLLLMRDIERDSRHEAVEIVRQEKIAARRFGDWTMAYAGTSGYVRAQVEAARGAARDPAGKAADVAALLRLLHGFAVHSDVA